MWCGSGTEAEKQAKKKNRRSSHEAAKIMTPPELQHLREEYDVSMSVLKVRSVD
jgi:hypothetical protein